MSTAEKILDVLSKGGEMTRSHIVCALGMTRDKIRKPLKLLIDSGKVLRTVGNEGIEWLSINKAPEVEEVVEVVAEPEVVEVAAEPEVVEVVAEPEEVVEEVKLEEPTPSYDMLGRAKAAGIKEGIKIGERKMLYKMSRMVHVKLVDILLDETVGIDERIEL